MADASEIKHAEELLQLHLMEWRDAGGHIESVTGSILRLIVARERFAEVVRAEMETRVGHAPGCQKWVAIDQAFPAFDDSMPCNCGATANR